MSYNDDNENKLISKLENILFFKYQDLSNIADFNIDFSLIQDNNKEKTYKNMEQ